MFLIKILFLTLRWIFLILQGPPKSKKNPGKLKNNQHAEKLKIQAQSRKDHKVGVEVSRLQLLGW